MARNPSATGQDSTVFQFLVGSAEFYDFSPGRAIQPEPRPAGLGNRIKQRLSPEGAKQKVLVQGLSKAVKPKVCQIWKRSMFNPFIHQLVARPNVM
jgi:hypothetical protein